MKRVVEEQRQLRRHGLSERLPNLRTRATRGQHAGRRGPAHRQPFPREGLALDGGVRDAADVRADPALARRGALRTIGASVRSSPRRKRGGTAGRGPGLCPDFRAAASGERASSPRRRCWAPTARACDHPPRHPPALPRSTGRAQSRGPRRHSRSRRALCRGLGPYEWLAHRGAAWAGPVSWCSNWR
jgi:hypothetical protein